MNCKILLKGIGRQFTSHPVFDYQLGGGGGGGGPAVMKRTKVSLYNIIHETSMFDVIIMG